MKDYLTQNKGLPERSERAIICPQFIQSGRSAVRLARLHGVQEVPGSIPGAPTKHNNQLLIDFLGVGFIVTNLNHREKY